jgi:hypothetical protein
MNYIINPVLVLMMGKKFTIYADLWHSLLTFPLTIEQIFYYNILLRNLPGMNNDSPTLIELAYELISTQGPLSVEEIAALAFELGYQVAGWEFQAEIEEHMLSFGEDSPFVPVGYDQYGLWEEGTWDEPSSLPPPHYPQTDTLPPPPYLKPDTHAPLEFIFPAAIAVAIILALALAIFAAGGPSGKMTRTANAVFLPTTVVNSDALQLVIPAAAAAEPLQATVSLDPTWWFGNTTNQMNEATQAIARQYLSNYYNTCGPAVVAMLATFILGQREEGGGPVTTALVMQAAREQLGYYVPPYNSGLLTFKHLRAMLELYGIHHAYPEGEGSLLKIEELLERVRQGQPAIAGMRYAYQGDWMYRPSGGSGLYNHFVIVFAIEQQDGQEYLWVANTHPGKYLTSDSEAAPTRMSIDEFWQSWAIKDGSENSDYGHAVFYGG